MPVAKEGVFKTKDEMTASSHKLFVYVYIFYCNFQLFFFPLQDNINHAMELQKCVFVLKLILVMNIYIPLKMSLL